MSTSSSVVSFIYSDVEAPRRGFPIPYDRLDATKHWTTHFGNYMFLKFILNNSDKFLERQRATKEILICERKLAYWTKHPNFDQKRAEQNKTKIQNDWAVKPKSKPSQK